MGKRTEDLTIEILKEIRDAVRETNVRVEQTNARLDQTNARLDQTNERLDQTNERLDNVEKTLAEMAAQFVFISRFVKNSVKRHETRLDALEGRVTKLEHRG